MNKPYYFEINGSKVHLQGVIVGLYEANEVYQTIREICPDAAAEIKSLNGGSENA